MSFFRETHFYVLLCTQFVAPGFFALVQGEICAAIFRLNLRACALILALKLNTVLLLFLCSVLVSSCMYIHA